MARLEKWFASVVGICVLMLLFALFEVQPLDIGSGLDSEGAPHINPRQPSGSVSCTSDAEALRYVPRSVVETWTEREFFIVLGIPSVDIEARRRRRNLQRSTCWRFPDVATRANEFSGAMLVLYVLARHSSNGYNYSAALQAEAAWWNDVIVLPMNEGRVTTNKTVGGSGFWGVEAEIGMSRKTYFWFDFALRQFPTAPYVAKGDDGIFLCVPQFLVDLRTVPRRGIYWGLLEKCSPGEPVDYVNGRCMALARDVARQFVVYEPLRRLVCLRYSAERESEFLSLSMNHEDVMVGRVLREVRCEELVYVKEGPYRFHDVHIGTHLPPVSHGLRLLCLPTVWESRGTRSLDRRPTVGEPSNLPTL
ncbi:UDP-Gal or UDP-GlcNAc-dependent glycosyltransferase [Trypanosoma rangeli SC58]|uniref:Hexosyltransferase n=1 Tax=Trypanosoma rangeli SC58 TaxID=429131 RepID=A0A061J5R5_TRYRA|nr:UDP-Gal or UDP-GlcNAc-dependent glycosyltransferase [Trypanosoma rangeli SC58]